jgi:hypothetical protein
MEQEAAALAMRYWQIGATATSLPGERDRNFLLVAEAGERYVLKIAHESEDPAFSACQDEALARLAAARTRFRFPRIVPAADGTATVRIAGAGGVQHNVRVVEHVDGQPLAETRPRLPHVLREVGALAGTVTRVLEGWDPPAAHRDLRWDLRNARAVIDRYLRALRDPDRRAMVEAFLPAIDARVPMLATLRTGVIHGDANDWNVLVRPIRPPDPLRVAQVAGLIDFGDLIHTWVLAEPAITAAYALFDSHDPLAAACDVVAGCHYEHAIPEAELEAIFPLICLRLCASVVLSAQARIEQPGNAYLFVSEAPAWAALRQLRRIHPDHAHCAFRAACGFSPSPASDRVTAWLRDNVTQAAPMFGIQLDAEHARVLDLSAGTTQFGDAPAPGDVRAMDEAIGRVLEEGNAIVGIGRHAEARLTRPDRADDDEARSLHLGIDVYAPAGTLVRSPLSATVEELPDSHSIMLRHDVAPAIRFWLLCRGLSVAPLHRGDDIERGQPVGTVAEEGAHGGAPHVHVQLAVDVAVPDAFVRPSDRVVHGALSPDPNLLLRLPLVTTAQEERLDDLLTRRKAVMGASLSVAYRRPLFIVRGWRQHLYDRDGRVFLDAVNNVAHVGHEHPHVVRALQRQAAVLNTNTRYLHGSLVRYAERLAATLPDPLRVCFFVCSGSEANELALRMARAHTGRHDVLVLDGAYHGNTSALVDISPYKFAGPGGRGKPEHVHVAASPDPYRGAFRGADAGARYAEALRETVQRASVDRGGIAAFFAESRGRGAGAIVPPDGFLAQAFTHVRAAGGICVADEVQTGLGRVGTHMWAFETQNAMPDIVTIGKPSGNGHPLAAVVTTPEIARSFANGMEYFNTFGGNPVSCAVGLAVLDVLEAEGLQQNAQRVGARLLGRLADAMQRHALIGDVRGRGLFIGIELVLDRDTREPAGAHSACVAERMRDLGILLSTDGPFHNVLKIKPPLVFTESDADRLVDTLVRVLAEDPLRVD